MPLFASFVFGHLHVEEQGWLVHGSKAEERPVEQTWTPAKPSGVMPAPWLPRQLTDVGAQTHGFCLHPVSVGLVFLGRELSDPAVLQPRQNPQLAGLQPWHGGALCPRSQT